MLILTVPRHSFPFKFCLIAAIWCNFNGFSMGQSILDRFRPTSNISAVDDQVKIISGTKVKRYERLTVPIGGVGGNSANFLHPHPTYVGLAYVRNPPVIYFPRLRIPFVTHWPYYPVRVAPQWQAGAKIMGEGIEGIMTFQQLPYNNDIKVILNATGVPAGKHALHIHTYGDLSDGCKSTGGQFANNFLGNIDVKEDGVVSVAFISIYLNLFGYNGIIGRSVVIHEKPIDLNNALNAEVFSSPILTVSDAQSFQNEENSVKTPWQAGAKIMGEGIEGLMTFQKLPFSNGIKVTLNATGIPAGKHALHIHVYGDISEDCKSTGGQFANNFLGNIDVKEDGVVSLAFISVYLNLFGYNGIIGRSVVIHEKPLAQTFQNKENSVGESIACGIISIMNVPIATINKK